MAAQVSGSGSTNYVPRWTSGSTLGTSIILETNGKLGVRNANPAATIDVLGASGGSGQNAPSVLNVVGGKGGSASFNAGTGAKLQLTSGSGGNAGTSSLIPGKGATFVMTGGTGVTCVAASTRCAFVEGYGGSIFLQPGTGGRGSGNVLLAQSAGRVGIKTGSPTASLTVGVGGTTLADAWTIRSSLRFKSNVRPLLGAINTISKLRGVTYNRKLDGVPEIGLIAEEVVKVVPQLVSRDPDTGEVQGVDYARLTAVLIEAVKSQQVEIAALKAQVARLAATSNPMRGKP
jgi:hypothetical protein